jgi:hypothetical protein
MGTMPFHIEPREDETEEQARQRVLRRFEGIGLNIMNRTSGGGPMAADPIAGVLSDPSKRKVAAQLLGQAYVAAHHLVLHNRKAVENTADALLERKELFGDELVELLNAQKIAIPKIDLNDESFWPPAFFSASSEPRPALPSPEGPS